MPVKPSEPEEEYFARQELDLRRKLAEERQAEVAREERERLKALHSMRCPKCGMQLEEIAFGDVKVDKCLSCEGIFLDKGELDALQKKEPGFVSKLLGVFGE